MAMWWVFSVFSLWRFASSWARQRREENFPAPSGLFGFLHHLLAFCIIGWLERPSPKSGHALPLRMRMIEGGVNEND